MIGVLLHSSTPGGESPWAAVRGSKEILLRGMTTDDLVEIKLRGNGHDGVSFFGREKDVEFGIPEGVEFIKAIHHEAGDRSNVSVDMR